MDFDLTTKTGWQKFLVSIVGIVSSVGLAFGMSQAAVDSIVAIVTALIPIIAAIAYYIVNQLAAKGKAAATSFTQTCTDGVPKNTSGLRAMM